MDTGKEIEYRLSFGTFVSNHQTTFKLLAPEAEKVSVVIFSSPEDESGIEHPMFSDNNGIWIATIKNAGYGTLYGYRLEGPSSQQHVFSPEIIVGDPYAKATITQVSHNHLAKSLIIEESFDWEGDRWVKLNPRDAIIKELHIRDMTIHPTSGVQNRGTYLGLVEPNQRGGIAHISEMGYNAVELLPAMSFANLEDSTSRNHWGYMTNYFFAPENYYAKDGSDKPGTWMGTQGSAVREFKEMVKAFHKEGIAVLMDVVYNHVSNTTNPFRYINREIYFRLDKKGDYTNYSGCGNDLRTDNPGMRQLILESVKYWMMEYHIDGFRFDLANLIDEDTCKIIIEEARQINPDVLIIAEPWGDGYNPHGFSDIGWASWNDLFRNGIKGQDPIKNKGFIFGQWFENQNQAFLQSLALGSLREFSGPFNNVAHCVNYLESHDDYTLGDFIRIGSKQIEKTEVIKDTTQNAKVREKQLLLNKLGALFLFTSLGTVMVHQGQSWGRSKVIVPTTSSDNQAGQLDSNSYNKDNETNWLNWDHKDLNRDLVDYYKGLIKLRKGYSEFRHSNPDDFLFFDMEDRVAIVYLLQDKFIVGMNGNIEEELKIHLPDGLWQLIVDSVSVNLNGKGIISGSLSIPPTSGVVLRRR